MGKRITIKRLREVLSYEAETGIFRWKVRTSNRSCIGAVAGCVAGQGYNLIGIDGLKYKASVLAWAHTYGRWPKLIVDHKSTNKTDDSIGNLRLATKRQNAANTGPHRTNRLGVKGVIARNGRFQASIRGKSIGRFDTPEQAHAAYMVAATERYGKFARGTI